MAAETIIATRAASTFPVFTPSGAGIVCAAWGSYDVPAGNLLEVGDVLKMCVLPKNATVLGGVFMGADIDTGTETLDIDVGWAANGVDAADEDGFGNFGVLSGDVITELIPVAGIYRPLQGVLLIDGPKTFAAETTIQLDVNAVAAAGSVGRLSLVVYYVVGS